MAPLHHLKASVCHLWLEKKTHKEKRWKHTSSRFYFPKKQRKESRKPWRTTGNAKSKRELPMTFSHFKLGYVFVSGESTYCCLSVSCILYKLASENKRAILTFRIVKRPYTSWRVVTLCGIFFSHMCISCLHAASIVRMWLCVYIYRYIYMTYVCHVNKLVTVDE